MQVQKKIPDKKLDHDDRREKKMEGLVLVSRLKSSPAIVAFPLNQFSRVVRSDKKGRSRITL